MPYAVLEKKLQAMPERYFDQISSFFDLLLSLDKQTEEKSKNKIKIGLAEEKYKVSSDPNAGDEVVADMFEGYL